MSLAFALIGNLLIVAGVMAAVLVAIAITLALGSRLRFSTGGRQSSLPSLKQKTSTVLSPG